MSKIFTKVSSLALAAAVVGSGFSVNASAAELDANEFENVVSTQENVGLNDLAPGVTNTDLVVPYGTSKPTSTWDLSKDGRYSFSGYLNSVRSLYTNYLLTGKSSVKIYVNNLDHQYSVKFKVMRKDLIFDNQIGSYSVAAGSSGVVTVSLDSSSNYYIEFQGPCDFSGYIE